MEGIPLNNALLIVAIFATTTLPLFFFIFPPL